MQVIMYGKSKNPCRDNDQPIWALGHCRHMQIRSKFEQMKYKTAYPWKLNKTYPGYFVFLPQLRIQTQIWRHIFETFDSVLKIHMHFAMEHNFE